MATNLSTGNWTATAGTNTCNGLALTTNTTDYVITTGVTVTLVAANTVVGRSLTIQSGGTLIFAATTSTLNLGDNTSGTAGAGNVALFVVSGATITLTGIGTINLISTSATQQTITTGGKTLPNVTINGAGSSYVLGDAFTSSGAFTVTSGTFSTSGSNFSITCATFVPSAATARTITLGSSSITCSGGASALNIGNTGNLTMTANTAVVTLTGAAGTAALGGFNYNGMSVVFSGSGAQGFIGGFTGGTVTLNNVTRTGTAAKTDSFINTTAYTVTGALTINSNSDINRILVQSATVGTAVTITAASVSLTNVDFTDITIQTAGSTYLASDSFNRANGSLGTSDSASGGTNATWGSATGTWAIASNAVVAPPTGGSIGLAVGASDMRVSAKLTANSPNSGDSTIICARYTDFNNSLMLFCYPTGQVTLYSKVAGSYTNVATMTGTFAVGDTLGLQVIGLNYMVTKNGVSMGTGVVPSTILNSVTNAGIGFNGSGGASVIIDDFKVQATTATGTSLGDALGNSGITFTTPVTRYGVVAGNWSNTATWSSTSGGSGGSSVPLPQDNVILDASSAAGTYTMDMPRLGKDLDLTGFTRTFSTSVTFSLYGSLTIGSGCTWTMGNSGTFGGRGSHTITSNGKTINNSTFAAFGGTYALQDAWIGSGSIQHNYGTLTTNNYSIAVTNFYSTLLGSGTRTFNGGTSVITISGGLSGTAFTANGTGMTWNGTAVSIVLTTASPLTRVFAGGGYRFKSLTYNVANSPGQLTITGSNTFDTVTFGSGRTIANTAGAIQTVLDGAGSTMGGVNNGFLYIPGVQTGVGGVAVSTPNSAALQLTGSITIDAKINLANYVPGTTMALAMKSNGLSVGYGVRLNALGLLTLFLGTTQASSTVSLSTVLTNGQTYWVRVSWDDPTNLAKFYWSVDGVSWTQLGASVSLVSTGIPTGTELLYVGSRTTGNDSFTGAIYQAKVWGDSTQSSLVFHANFETKAFGANTFTESSTNAATVTIDGAINQVGDGRLAFTSTTPGTQTFWQLFGAPAIMDYLTVQDTLSSEPYKFYAGANSVSVSNNTNVNIAAVPAQPYIAHDADMIPYTAASGSATFMASHVATVGNLLVLSVVHTGNAGTVTTPTGWTLVDTSTSGANTVRIYYKIADGTESTVTLTSSSPAGTQLRMLEIGGWGGIPTLDVNDKATSGGSNVTSLSTGSGVTNTLTPGFALAAFGGNSTLGLSVSVTNSFQWFRAQAPDATTYAKVAAKPLLATGSQSTTYTWTTSRSAASQLVVFKDVPASTGNMLLVF